MRRVLLCCDLVVTLRLNSFSNRLWHLKVSTVLKCILLVLVELWGLEPRDDLPTGPWKQIAADWLVWTCLWPWFSKMGLHNIHRPSIHLLLLIKVTAIPRVIRDQFCRIFYVSESPESSLYGLGVLPSPPSMDFRCLITTTRLEKAEPQPLYWDKEVL